MSPGDASRVEDILGKPCRVLNKTDKEAASFTYRAQMLYDTNPSDDDSTVAADTAPDTGWSAPVRSNG